MIYEDPHDPTPVPRLEREQRLRLFEQLHQAPEKGVMVGHLTSRRANGFVRCEHCLLVYRDHYLDEESWDYNGEPFDRRLCNGDVVHL